MGNVLCANATYLSWLWERSQTSSVEPPLPAAVVPIPRSQPKPIRNTIRPCKRFRNTIRLCSGVNSRAISALKVDQRSLSMLFTLPDGYLIEEEKVPQVLFRCETRNEALRLICDIAEEAAA